MLNKKPTTFIALVCLIALMTAFAIFAMPKDPRPIKIRKYLEQTYAQSPIIGHEQEIVYWSDQYDLDYRLYVAIAGCESSFGKRYPRWSSNLTGYGIFGGNIRSFPSIYQNIQTTLQGIGTKSFYAKYRNTKHIPDLVYIYKGVPPFAHYINNMNYIMASIEGVNIKE